MIRKLYGLLAAALLLASAGCIRNDIPYPVVTIGILGITGEGFTCESKDIDSKECVATLRLDEKTDISKVQITGVELTEGGKSSVELVATHDLRTPIYTTLRLYQDYPWEIRAEQTIERYFEVEHQIGAAVIDPEAQTVHISVSKEADLTDIRVLRMKLGPADITTYSPDIEELSGTSFVSFRTVDIRYHDFAERWTIYTEITDQTVRLERADAWSKWLWLYGEGVGGQKLGFKYRRAGDTEWIDITEVTATGGSFNACIKGLTPSTQYEVLAYSGDEQTPPQTVTTDSAPELTNGGFEQWSVSSKNSKLYFPYTDEENRFWDTGNRGATTVGDSNTIPMTDSPRPGSAGTTYAKLQSKYIIVKFAAGNLFVGNYFTTIGTNGVVGFGQPFPHRPTKLRGWVKFKGGPINRIGTIPAGVEIVKDKTPENGMIYVALGNWTPDKYGVDVKEISGATTHYGTQTTPIAIYTKDLNSFFNPHSEAVIGYGEKVMVEEIADWTAFEIEIDYKNKVTVPTHIVIVCSASRYGDYFTGCDSSVLCVDDFELLYD